MKFITGILISWFLVFSGVNGMLYAQKKTSYTVFFASGNYILSGEEKAKLAALMKTDTMSILRISIYAYCDDTGSELFNDILSLNRAKAVKKILTASGIDSRIITIAEGKGELPLTDSANAEQQRAFHRRADIITEKLQRDPPAPVKKDLIVAEKEISISPAEKENKKSFNNTLKVGDTLVFDNILFLPGMHQLQRESYSVLKELVKSLREEKKYHILILGHVCCRPPGEDGMDIETGLKNLSTARAKAIYDYLIKNGIDKERLAYRGLGSNHKTGKGDYYDRRVEITITDIKY